MAYTYLLDTKMLPTIAPWLCRGTSTVESVVYSWTKGLIAKGMISLMRCRYSRVPAATKELEQLFDKLGARLQGRRYLCGDGTAFTAADLTFASLAYPVVFPEEFGDVMIAREDLPDEFRQLVDRLRATPAGQHALRCYQEHRFVADDRARVLVRPNRGRDDGLYLKLAGAAAAAAGLVWCALGMRIG